MAGGACILTRFHSALENAEIWHNPLVPSNQKSKSVFNTQELCVCVCVCTSLYLQSRTSMYIYIVCMVEFKS